MDKIISKTLTVTVDKMPPETFFVENEIRKQGLEPIRWAIVEVQENILILNVSGYEI